MFLKNAITNNLILDFSLGAEEACRNKNNFQINFEKLIDMNQSIETLLGMDYLEVLEHSKLIKADEQIKDNSKKEKTNLLFINYSCLLKMYLLDKNRKEETNV